MKPVQILLSSYRFPPSIGGLETSSLFLAKGLTERGYKVTVVTATPGNDNEYSFAIVRQPSLRALFRLVRNADVIWQNHISLRNLWPLLFISRPLIFMHHISLRWLDDYKPHLGGLKRLACKFGRNVFVSKELRKDARLPGEIVPNTYDDKIFRVLPGIKRDRDVAFLGRLKRYKGTDTLIDAVATLASDSIEAKTTVIGFGPEQKALKKRAYNKGIDNLVNFAGPQRGEALAQLLNRHRIVVIPSRCEEAFGIVALEAFACGCVVVAAESGALPEVIGPAGIIFPKEDVLALAAILKRLLADPKEIDGLRQHIPAQLAKFDKAAILDACENVIKHAARPSQTVQNSHRVGARGRS